MAIIWQKIDSIEELTQLSKQWEALNNAYSQTPLFTSPVWILNWFEVFWQKHWHLCTYAGFKNEKLIAVLPFYYQSSSKFITLKELFFLGQGEQESAEVASEYLDIIAHPDYEADALSFFQATLNKHFVDSFSARAIAHDSIILKAFSDTVKVPNGTQFIIKRSNWQITSLSKNTRNKIRRFQNRSRQEAISCRWVNIEEKQAMWQLMSEFHQKRWQKKGAVGAFSESRFHAFHQPLLSDEKQTQFSVMLKGSQVIAINYYLLDKKHLYFYQSGWDDNSHSTLSPGFNLHIWSIENSEQEYYDFMMGKSEKSYKSMFNTNQNKLYKIVLNYHPIKHLVYRVIQKIFLN